MSVDELLTDDQLQSLENLESSDDATLSRFATKFRHSLERSVEANS